MSDKQEQATPVKHRCCSVHTSPLILPKNSYIHAMASFKRFFENLLRPVDNFADSLRRRLKTLTGWGRRSPLSIAPYRGYGRPDYIRLRGRVLKYKPLYGATHDSRWKNLIDTYRRFETDEIQDATLEVHIDQHRFELITDDEGYFLLDRPLNEKVDRPADTSWKPAKIILKRTPWREVHLENSAEWLLPSPRATFGVISDIDDTILQTHVTSLLKLKMLYYTLFKNAAGRRPFREVTAFYQALHQQSEELHNPFFYVSNSPWNLYDMLQEFMHINHLPKGPILLRDIGVSSVRPAADYRGHKYETIKNILKTYTGLSFLLIGDSGERDADIYLDIAKAFPEQIKGIYIRDVRSPSRANRIAELIRNTTDVDIRLINNYGEAAAHAADKGWIKLDDFEAFREKLKRE